MAMDEANGLARELVTASWTVMDRKTPEAAGIYQRALERTVSDADTAVDVMHAVATLAVIAVMQRAGARGVEYEDALADFFRTVDEEGDA
jgi:ABC-type branched-subunit amino acid transport system substrate-binding protein